MSTGNTIEKGVANHASKAYDFSHFMPFPELVHSQQPLAREGKNIPSTSFEISTNVAEPSISVYEIEIQSDSDPDPVPTPKREARKMTGNPSDTQKTKNLALCHTISLPLERCNKLPMRCYMARYDQLQFSQKNRVDHRLFIQKEAKVTFLLPSIIILGEDG